MHMGFPDCAGLQGISRSSGDHSACAGVSGKERMNKREVRKMNELRDAISDMSSNKYFFRPNMLFLFDELMKGFGYTYSDGGYSKARVNNLEEEK